MSALSSRFMVGASLLWVGWFGFNAGSAGAANAVAGLAFVNTVLATAAAALSWILGESLHKGKASMLGAASGAVAGLVCLWGVGGLKRMLNPGKVIPTLHRCAEYGKMHGPGPF